MDIIRPSTKGQVVIPKSIRDQLGINEHTQLAISTINDQIVLKVVDTEKIRREVEAFWEMRRKAPKLSMDEINRVIKEARARIRAEGRGRHECSCGRTAPSRP